MDKVCPICGSSQPEDKNVCTSCGFRFIESTQQFKPLTFDADVTSNQRSNSQAALRIVRGPQRGNVFTLTSTVSTLGRNPQCEIFLNDMTVSREHAIIAATERGYVITDRKSYNGVWVNNQLVDTKLLADGDVIQIGTFCLVFEA